MKQRLLSFILLLVTLTVPTFAQRISVSGTQFQVSGNQIWLNGANTPWHNWSDFGTGNYDNSWWDSHLQSLQDAHINCVRVWISTNGSGINVNSDGTVTGVTSNFFSDLDQFFTLAQNHHIYVLATLLSQNFTDNNTSSNTNAWRACFSDSSKVSTLINNYVTPFVNRYKNNPYLFAVDICNEPEWMNQNASEGSLSWSTLQYLVGAIAAAVHSDAGGAVLTTVGSAAIKWNSSVSGMDGNYWSDSALQSQYSDSNARLDFYQTHWYGWQVYWFGNPATSKAPSDYGINDRPNILGEVPAKGMYTQDSSGNEIQANNPTDTYEGCYQHGWQGVCAWSSNGVDSYGSLSDFSSATTTFYNNHTNLVNGAGSSGGGSSGIPFNQTIGFKANATGYYVSADYNNNSYLRGAWASSIGSWEQFTVVDTGDGYVALKASNGLYVSCDLNSGDGLRPGWSSSIGDWEKFTWEWVDQSNHIFALKAKATGDYVSCNLNWSDILQASWATSIGDWEKFTSSQ